MTEHAKYVRCSRCGTWRPRQATVRDTSGPLGLTETVCKDTVWCAALAQKAPTLASAVEDEIKRRG